MAQQEQEIKISKKLNDALVALRQLRRVELAARSVARVAHEPLPPKKAKKFEGITADHTVRVFNARQEVDKHYRKLSKQDQQLFSLIGASVTAY